MTDLIDEIGPFLGIAAFLGLAILAFLIIQQAREVRRLREWAGRAPERADEANEAEVAAAEARGEEVEPAEPEEAPPSRAALWLHGVRGSVAERWAEVDRRLPVDPRYIVAVLVAAVIAAGILTGGFGFFGDDDGSAGAKGGEQGGGKPKEEKVEVAVLNATQEESAAGGEIAGVQGLAGVVAKEVVQKTDFAVGEKTDAPSGFDETTVMFEPEAEADADELAEQVTDQLGEPDVTPMIGEIRDVAGGAPLALIIGQDDADFGS